MNIQIGKYKRPGIFIERYDNSIFTTPVVDGITNLVIGSSKKGPFNTLVKLTNNTDLESIYGTLDRNLERKGSFFHRTVSKMLETAPVYAMNLLLTDDTLDIVEYKSLSAAADYINDVKREGPYRRFFDTTGFWKRDTESFINLTSGNLGYDERAFNLVNLSEKAISVFIFKSAMTGFDRTLLEWYGTIDKMPTYVNQQDYASDYLIDIVVVSGDWSNYQELAVDNRWSRYFNSTGLIKSEIRNFANDRNINLLAYYEGISLIPYFRDLNGKNIFIETTINAETDKTGLFCAFNNDIVETDYYNGKLDLLGNTIVGKNETEIEFLSYKELISEEVSITANPLDLPGNVTALVVTNATHAYGDVPMTSGIIQNTNRTSWFAEGYVHDVVVVGTVSSTASISFDYLVGADAYAVIGDELVQPEVGTVSMSITPDSYPLLSSTVSYVATTVLSEDGDISMVTTLTPSTNPTVATSDIVLGYVEFDIYNGEFANVVYNYLTVDEADYIPLVNGYDYDVSDETNGKIKLTFSDTAVTPNVTQYERYRKFKLFNRMIALLNSANLNRMAMNLGISNSYTKYRLENASILNIVTVATSNKSFELQTTLTSAELADVVNDGYFVLYTVDDEILLGEDGMVTKDELGTTSMGIVAKDSLLYSRFYEGIINSRDYFYNNRLYLDSTYNVNTLVGESVSIEFIEGIGTYDGYNYIVFGTDGVNFDAQVGLAYNEKIIVPDSELNLGTFTILMNSVDSKTPAQLATALGFSGDYYAYEVSENIEVEVLADVTMVYDFNVKNYLEMYVTNEGNLEIAYFGEIDLISPVQIDTQANNTFIVQSRKSNLKQSVEIEIPTGYTREPNKILVNAARYTEIRPGDFLEAYYDESALEDDQYPRKLTRILSKKQYVGDSTLAEITCDARIKVYTYGDDLQTMRYVGIDNYATTYKAITLKGFKVRAASLPDGTETRQNQILNLVAKGTPLFKALANKEAVDFRYLIDSYGLGLTERSKQQLVDICGSRRDLFGFINMPSMRQFKNSSSPSFVNSEGVLQTSYIAMGGNPDSNPAFLYSFGDGDGVANVGYFTPYLTVNDNGRPLDMPPASHVATTYMRKHISNITSMTPWTIAAGVTNGKITNIAGVEIDFTNEDIENLNGAMMNPIVYKRNRGYIIETENTGQTLYKSALSYAHSTEVMIELERELSRMLLDYQWKYNTPDVRAEIKLRADVICETFVNKNGLYDYFNKMDDENNTPDIIDNQIGVIDTYIEIIKGMGIIVNNITILRTGAIQSGGFMTI